MTGALRAILLMLALSPAAAATATDIRHELADFSDLPRWAHDDHAAALEVFLETCPDMTGADWQSLCALAQTGPEPRTFFELFFRPVLITDGKPALFTGYFEPELSGALRPDARFRYPVYRMPPEARRTSVWLSRREILNGDALAGRGLEIAWVDDPVELFFNPDLRFPKLYAAYKEWCEEHGYSEQNQATFGRSLPAAFPQIQRFQPRNEGSSRGNYHIGIGHGTSGTSADPLQYARAGNGVRPSVDSGRACRAGGDRRARGVALAGGLG